MPTIQLKFYLITNHVTALTYNYTVTIKHKNQTPPYSKHSILIATTNTILRNNVRQSESLFSSETNIILWLTITQLLAFQYGYDWTLFGNIHHSENTCICGNTEIILCIRPVNVKSSLIGWGIHKMVLGIHALLQYMIPLRNW